MEEKDLMIGDWVMYNPNVFIEDEYETAKEWYPMKITSGEDIELAIEGCYGPIQLTPEILKKSGFALKPDGWLWCKEEGIEDKNYIFIQFRKGCEEVRLVELNFVNNVLAKYEQMHYVHELQHVLRLCGIKKEIEL